MRQLFEKLSPPPRVAARMSFLLTLLVILICVSYFVHDPGLHFLDDILLYSPPDYSSWFATVFAVMHVAIFILIPVVTAGSIANERERDSLETLLLTPLSTLQILLEKGLASLRSVYLLGVPVVLVVLFSCTVPDMDTTRIVLIGISYPCAVLLDLCISLCASAYAKITRTALILAYVAIILMNALWYGGPLGFIYISKFGSVVLTVIIHILFSALALMLAYQRMNYLRNRSGIKGDRVLIAER